MDAGIIHHACQDILIFINESARFHRLAEKTISLLLLYGNCDHEQKLAAEIFHFVLFDILISNQYGCRASFRLKIIRLIKIEDLLLWHGTDGTPNVFKSGNCIVTQRSKEKL